MVLLGEMFSFSMCSCFSVQNRVIRGHFGSAKTFHMLIGKLCVKLLAADDSGLNRIISIPTMLLSPSGAH